jgi:hypothetical protein
VVGHLQHGGAEPCRRADETALGGPFDVAGEEEADRPVTEAERQRRFVQRSRPALERRMQHVDRRAERTEHRAVAQHP